MSEKAAVQAPIANDRESSAATVTAGSLSRIRAPKRASRSRDSSHAKSLASRLDSRIASWLPRRRWAARAASAGSLPSRTNCAARVSMWYWSSSRKSRSRLSPRNTFVKRDSQDISPPLRPLQYVSYSGGHGQPAGLLVVKLAAALSGDFIETRAPFVFGSHPFGANPAGLFHAVQRGIERALLHAQNVVGHGLDMAGDAIPVDRSAAGENFQHQQGQGPLHCILTGHTQFSQ